VVVGTLILLRIVIDERKPFATSRDVGCYLVECDYISGYNALIAK